MISILMLICSSDHSKALKCMFFGEWKNSCSSNLCNLSYLIDQKNVQLKHTVQIFRVNNKFISQKVFLLIWIEYNMNIQYT